ncbi:hypothetical protein [Microbacterium sp.]|uniref:hypothetical protein n=1 Tax=Microbacterium sp. TaxID=51671 RepID=UPI00333F6B97
MTGRSSGTAPPRAFTLREFWRGVFAAWLAFLIVLVLFALLFAGGGVLMILPSTLLIGGTISAITALLGSPVAFALGRVLRDVRSTPVHLLLFGLLGAIIGVVVVLAMSRGGAGFGDPYTWMVAGITALCVDIGWCWTSRRRRREDPRPQAPVSVP